MFGMLQDQEGLNREAGSYFLKRKDGPQAGRQAVWGAEKKPSLGTKHLIKHSVHGKVCLLATLAFLFRSEVSRQYHLQ